MKKSTTENFVRKSNIAHDHKYNYEKAIYVKSRNKLIITCSKHGDFTQIPSEHLRGKGCPKCGPSKQSASNTISFDDFVNKANEKHDFKYSYVKSSYKNSFTKMKMICSTHGIFKQTPSSHLQYNGCYDCGRISTSIKLKYDTSTFITKAKDVHKDRYNYSLVNYKSSREKVEIICKIHGAFKQSPKSHLQGENCSKCYKPSYSKSKWTQSSIRNNKSILYVINCFNDSEDFIKIGITSNKINRRFSNNNMPYSYNVISIINRSPEEVWDLEKSLHTLCHEFSYNPKNPFPGKTECFKIQSLHLLYSYI